MFLTIFHWKIKMIRIALKVGFLMVIFTQFQTGSYNFLHASESETEVINQIVRIMNHSLIRDHNDFDGDVDRDSVINGILWEKGSPSDSLNYWNGLKEVSKRMQNSEFVIFEKRLLQLLGMKERPKGRSVETEEVPKYLRELYEVQRGSEFPSANLNLPGRLTRSANTVRSFYASEIINAENITGIHTILTFDLNSIPKNELITAAELQIPFTWNNTDKAVVIPSLQILIHDLVKISKGDKSSSKATTGIPPIMYPMDSKPFGKGSESGDSISWITFDVSPAISRWATKNSGKSSKSKTKKLNLAIEIVQKSSKKQAKTESNSDHRKSLRVKRSSPTNRGAPMLLTFSDDGKNGQMKDAKTLSRHYRAVQNQRRKNHRHKNRRRNLCGRRKMFVDFTDVGWNDWIVAPPGYQAFYCSGECPFPMAEHLNATNHAVIQALVNSMNPRLVPPPCCVPNKYSSLSLLYTDSSDRIVLKNYNQMIVDSCGCN